MAERAGTARRFAEHHHETLQRAIEGATVVGEQAPRRIERAYSKAAHGGVEFQQKVLEIAQANVDAAFACARELVGVTSPSEFVAVSTRHVRQQFQSMTRQTRELAELAQKAAVDSMGPFAGGVGGALLGRPDLS